MSTRKTFLVELADRAAILVGRYKKKYGSVLATAEWEEDELEELGSNLQKSIRAGMAEKAIALERIRRLCELV